MKWQDLKWAQTDRNGYKAREMAGLWAEYAKEWDVQTFLLAFDTGTAAALGDGRRAALQEAGERLAFVLKRVQERVFGRGEVKQGARIGWIDALEFKSRSGAPVTPHVHLVVAVPKGCTADLDSLVHQAWGLHWKPGPRHPMQPAHSVFSAAAYAMKHFDDLCLDRLQLPRTVRCSGWKARQYSLSRQRQVRELRALAELRAKEKRELDRKTGGLMEFVTWDET